MGCFGCDLKDLGMRGLCGDFGQYEIVKWARNGLEKVGGSQCFGDCFSIKTASSRMF